MGTNLSAGFFTNKPGPLAGAGLAAMEQDRIAKLELPGALPPENLSILDGSISPTRAAVVVDTEGGAPADDLTAISTTLSDGTTLHEGMELAIRAKDASRVITVKNSAAVNGILTADGKNVVLGTGWWLVLYLESGSWRQKNVSAPMEIATKNNLGLVKIGDYIKVDAEGRIYLDPWAIYPPRSPIPVQGVAFGGSDGRRAIMPGETTAREDWIVCDGGSDGKGGKVPDICDRMILGAGSKHPAGSTGGSETHDHSLSGTVGATTTSVAQTANHAHETSRGNNTGDNRPYYQGAGTLQGSISTYATGGSQPHTHSLAASTGTANNISPYYALAYIMRIA